MYLVNMNRKRNYIPNGGQTYMPFQDNIHVQTIDFTPLERPKTPIPSLELKEEFKEKGFILTK